MLLSDPPTRAPYPLVAALQSSALDPHWAHPGGTEISGYRRVHK